ncbi:hypothetical protein [Granulicella tundricola]|uniref:Uncharacterized protein n=1 Tax=Granulicella tundricola (strain ATCC BAA-1859 / DSM 23138 / MP5ACTX9) TaxID=1198114 RepID=E8X7G2_GRATM|nr:hypothetical protein [Granulicella tundricola]ADW71396.1 hypothetical protein AciX9_4450 [Granulicella tundricola MP5ACTX9]
MPIVLLTIFLKGPAWLKACVLLALAGLVVVGGIVASTAIRNATERTGNHHAHPTRTR